MAGREGGGGGLVALAMGPNGHGARTARDVLLATMGMVGQDTCARARCIAAIMTSAIAIAIGAVIIIVSMWLAGAPRAAHASSA